MTLKRSIRENRCRVELIALEAGTLRPCPIEGEGVSSREFLVRYGSPLGWVEETSPKGTPRFRLPGRVRSPFEPGGQLEFSTLAADSGGNYWPTWGTSFLR